MCIARRLNGAQCTCSSHPLTACGCVHIQDRLNMTQWGSKCKDGGSLRSDGNGRMERCYKSTGCRIIYELYKCARGDDIQHVAVMGPFGQFEDHLLVGCHMTGVYTPCPKKEATVFFLYNLNKCRHNFVIFGMNHPADSFYQDNRKVFPNIITSLRSDDVIVTSLETTLSRTASGKDRLQQYSV